MTTDTPLHEQPDQTTIPPSALVLLSPAETPETSISPMVPIPQPEPASEPVVEPTATPAMEPVAEPRPAPAAEHVAEPAPPAETPTSEDETEAPEQEQASTEAVAPLQPETIWLDWYVVKVQSGREETIKESIERRVKIDGLQEFYGQIFIPTEKVTEMRGKKRYIRDRKLLPGYFMAQIKFDDENRMQSLFRETSGVGDFVGATGLKKPIPMTEKEIQKWVGAKDGEPSLLEPIKGPAPFAEGDRVKIKDGMFVGMEGVIKQLLEAKGAVVVELTIFGRPVPVEHEYWQVDFA